MEGEYRIPHYVKKALARLRRSQLVRQASSTEEAIEKGDGHLFFTHPDGRPFGTRSAIFCIREGLVEPLGDDLLGTGSQTYRMSEKGSRLSA